MGKLEKLYDRTDAAKWAHPEIADQYQFMVDMAPYNRETIYNYDLPFEARNAAVEAMSAELWNVAHAADASENPSFSRRELYQAPGCPEEPDTPVEVVIYRPANPSKGKQKVMFCAAGGGMHTVMIEFVPFWALADKYNCMVVFPRYRSCMQAPYPAAINDLHAGYKWMIDNAEELGIDPDMVVLQGSSSGTNLILSLAHRLKRYGYRPRGCVADLAFADNRPIFKTSTIMSGGNWDARTQWLSSIQYLGPNNVSCFNSPEMYPNYATAEDCIGLPPTFMHVDAEEANSASCEAYRGTLSQAGVYNELHCWGGSCHGALANTSGTDPDSPYVQRYLAVLDGNITDCWKYDLRRQWIVDELGE